MEANEEEKEKDFIKGLQEGVKEINYEKSKGEKIREVVEGMSIKERAGKAAEGALNMPEKVEALKIQVKEKIKNLTKQPSQGIDERE